MKTLAEQLESVQSAIEIIEGGAASISINGRQLTRADLKTLYDREASLLRRIAAGKKVFRTLVEF